MSNSSNKLNDSFLNLMIIPLFFVLLPLINQRMVSIFDHMFSSASIQGLSNISPFCSIILHHVHKYVVLISGPFFMFDLGIDVVDPSLSALSVGSKISSLAQCIEIIGYFFPF